MMAFNEAKDPKPRIFAHALLNVFALSWVKYFMSFEGTLMSMETANKILVNKSD